MCASRIDSLTKILHKFSKEILGLAKQKGLECVYLGGEDASPEKVREQLSKKHSTYFHWSHGLEDALQGQKGGKEVSVIDIESAPLFSGYLIDVCACLSCIKLGRQAIKYGARAYLGYDDLLYVVDDDETEFIMNTSKRELLNGRSAGEACKAQRNAYRKPTQNPLKRELYDWNMFHCVILGDPKARI